MSNTNYKPGEPDQAAGQATATEPRPETGGEPQGHPIPPAPEDQAGQAPQPPIGHEAAAEQPPGIVPIELTILFDQSKGVIAVSAPEDKVLALGLLECAKDIINKREPKQTQKPRIIPGRMISRRPVPSA